MAKCAEKASIAEKVWCWFTELAESPPAPCGERQGAGAAARDLLRTNDPDQVGRCKEAALEVSLLTTGRKSR